MSIKVGIHMAVLCQSMDEACIPHLKTAKEIGYDGVQLPMLDPVNFDWRPFLAAKREIGIEYIPAADLSPAEDIGHADKEIRNAGVRRINAALEAAANMDCDTFVGALAEPWGIPKRDVPDNSYEYIVENLTKCALYAQKLGIRIGIEGVNRYEGRMYNTIDQGIKLCRDIGVPSAMLHVDTYHANIEETDICAALRRAGKRLLCMHFSENNRGTPGHGHIDFPRITDTLRGMNYDGYLTAECFFSPERDSGKTMFIWRKIEESGIKVATDYFQYMSALLSRPVN